MKMDKDIWFTISHIMDCIIFNIINSYIDFRFFAFWWKSIFAKSGIKLFVMMILALVGGMVCRHYCNIDDKGYIISSKNNWFKVKFSSLKLLNQIKNREEGIRTPGGTSPTQPFQDCTLSHSDTSLNYINSFSLLYDFSVIFGCFFLIESSKSVHQI